MPIVFFHSFLWTCNWEDTIIFLENEINHQITENWKTWCKIIIEIDNKFIFYEPGRDQATLDELGSWAIVYEIMLMIWITFGLGYLVMLISLITKSLRKPAKRAAKTFKKAEKILVDRIINEIVIMRSRTPVSFEPKQRDKLLS